MSEFVIITLLSGNKIKNKDEQEYESTRDDHYKLFRIGCYEFDILNKYTHYRYYRFKGQGE